MAHFLVDFLLTVWPALLLLTSGASWTPHIIAGGLILSLFLSAVSTARGKASLLTLAQSPRSLVREGKLRLPFLTHYRSMLLLSTCIAILAVDFRVFPRRFAKCETFGTSLVSVALPQRGAPHRFTVNALPVQMDVGVGMFVFSAALVSPLARRQVNRRRLASSWLHGLTCSSLTAVLPLLLLGIARTVTNKSANYQEHVSEYGTHWNFYFTVACVAVAASCLHSMLQKAAKRCPAPCLSLGLASTQALPSGPAVPHGSHRAGPQDGDADQARPSPAARRVVHLTGTTFVLLSCCIMAAYQAGLSLLGWEEFLLTVPRTSLLTANKEGILGVAGFLAVHLAGVGVGQWLHRPRQGQREWLFAVFQLVVAGAGLWLLLLALLGAWPMADLPGTPPGLAVSRRMVNAPYVVWVLAVNCFLLAVVIVCDMVAWHGREGAPTDSTALEVLNQHGLVAFLVANLATGAVNLGVRTLFVPDLLAVCILSGYLAVVVVVTSFVGPLVSRLKSTPPKAA